MGDYETGSGSPFQVTWHYVQRNRCCRVFFSLVTLLQITGLHSSIVLSIEYFNAHLRSPARGVGLLSPQFSNRPVLPCEIRNLSLNSLMYMKMHQY